MSGRSGRRAELGGDTSTVPRVATLFAAVMRAALLLLPILSPALAAYEKTLGVPPALLSKYSPQASGKWKCLDASKEIPWDFVNDDSCDCPDGSEEPGV